MLVKRIEASPIVRVRVGDVTIFVMKLEGKSVHLAVDAPQETEILIDNEDTRPPPRRRGS